MGKSGVNSQGAFRGGNDRCVVNSDGFGSGVRSSLVTSLYSMDQRASDRLRMVPTWGQPLGILGSFELKDLPT